MAFGALSPVEDGAGHQENPLTGPMCSEIEEALRKATGELVADMTQEISNNLKPVIPPEGSPITIGASPHRVQANHLVAGLTHTLGGVRIRPMPPPAAVPRSPFV